MNLVLGMAEDGNHQLGSRSRSFEKAWQIDAVVLGPSQREGRRAMSQDDLERHILGSIRSFGEAMNIDHHVLG